jgi:hypothetical protein
MKLALIVAAVIASVALAAPSEAASKKSKKTVRRAPIGAVQAKPVADPYEVYVSGELVGRDPDPGIRSYMMRNPHPWDGPD